MFAKSFHNFGTPVNALDIAPKHSGSVFGIINAIASTSGLATFTYNRHNKALKKTVDVNLFSNVSGFVGVYLAGYILELR